MLAQKRRVPDQKMVPPCRDLNHEFQELMFEPIQTIEKLPIELSKINYFQNSIIEYKTLGKILFILANQTSRNDFPKHRSQVIYLQLKLSSNQEKQLA